MQGKRVLWQTEMVLTEQAPAKINLSLDILGKREDGYHDLRMVMQSVSLCDTLRMEKAEGIHLFCREEEIPLDERNTVWKAAEIFLRETGFPGVRVELEKAIPSQAGLGGGSADAAAFLRGANRLYQAGLSPEKLREMGKQVGADVPFCVEGGLALAEGIGDRLTSLPPMPDCRILLCKPLAGVSTAAAYAQADQRPFRQQGYTKDVLRALETGSLSDIGRALGNDFQELCCLPEVEAIRKEMLAGGAAGALMSGSGSAVYGLFSPTSQEAECCREKLLSQGRKAFLCVPFPAIL